jgi:hypothetical protein
MTVKPLPNHEYLKSILKYHPHNGLWVWKEHRGNIAAGSIAGKCRGRNATHGYQQIAIDKKLYMAHRLAYYYMTGIDPEGLVVDHIDRNRKNNAFNNLRAATFQVNNLNHGREPTFCSFIRGRYQAQFTLQGKHYYCGVFDSADEATAASLARKLELSQAG